MRGAKDSDTKDRRAICAFTPPLFFSDRKEEGRKQSLVINLREGGKTIVKRRRKGIKRGRKPFISSHWNPKVISSGQDLETNTTTRRSTQQPQLQDGGL